MWIKPSATTIGQRHETRQQEAQRLPVIERQVEEIRQRHRGEDRQRFAARLGPAANMPMISPGMPERAEHVPAVAHEDAEVGSRRATSENSAAPLP